MSVVVRRLTLGEIETNAYLVGDTASGDALVVDPVDDAPLLARTAVDAGWTIRLILATHAHFDHILAAGELKALTGAPFWLHEADLPWLRSLPDQGWMFFGRPFPAAPEPDRLLTNESERITVGAIGLDTLFTPGHAPGHLAFYLRDADTVFSGDTLFAGSIGRTDLPGGNHAQLLASIRDVLLPLGDATRVLPGHGSETTIGRERQTNPFLQA